MIRSLLDARNVDCNGTRAFSALADSSLVAKGIHALARRRTLNVGAWHAHMDRAQSACAGADAAAVCRVLNACCRAPVDCGVVAKLYMERAARLLPQCSSRQLSIIANALARLQGHQLIADTLREARGKFARCSPADAAVLANACARLLHMDRTFFGHLLPRQILAMRRYSIKDIAQILNAYSKLRLRNTTVFEALSECACQQVPRMTCHAVSVICHAHAALRINNERLLQLLSQHLRGCARTCNQQAVATLLHSYSRASCSERLAVLESLTAEIGRLRGTFSTQSLCMMAGAAARFAPLPGARDLLAETLLELTQRHLASLPPRELASLCIALAESWRCASLEGVDLWKALSHVVVATSFAPDEAANCAVAFAIASLPAAVSGLRLQSLCQSASDEQPVSVKASIAIVSAHAICRLTTGCD